jgi:hypothetical protein
MEGYVQCTSSIIPITGKCARPNSRCHKMKKRFQGTQMLRRMATGKQGRLARSCPGGANSSLFVFSHGFGVTKGPGKLATWDLSDYPGKRPQSVFQGTWRRDTKLGSASPFVKISVDRVQDLCRSCWRSLWKVLCRTAVQDFFARLSIHGVYKRSFKLSMTDFLARSLFFLQGLFTRSLQEVSWQDLGTSSLKGISRRNFSKRSLNKICVQAICTSCLYEISWQDLCKRPLGKISARDLYASSLYKLLLRGLLPGSLQETSTQGLCRRSLWEVSAQHLCKRCLNKISVQKVSIKDLLARPLYKTSWQDLRNRSLCKVSVQDLYKRSRGKTSVQAL